MMRWAGVIVLAGGAGLCAQQMRPVTPPEVKRVEQKGDCSAAGADVQGVSVSGG